MEQTTTLVLAGGRGERLYPLTRNRAKPAVPFGGSYRVIDFTLSNCLNSRVKHVHLLTQYASLTLDRHVRDVWSNVRSQRGFYVELIPPQGQLSDRWYEGTADAIHQNIFLLNEEKPERVLILSGDHVYKMDYRPFLDEHERIGADMTVAVFPVPAEQAHHYGVLSVDNNQRVIAFDEKPANYATENPNRTTAWVSMGVYCFRTSSLVHAIIEDAAKLGSTRDFGRDIIPAMLAQGSRVFAYPFDDKNRKAEPYWRDVGSIDQYYASNMDLISVDPLFNLYDRTWQIHTQASAYPPAKTVFDDDNRRGLAVDSLLAPGVIVSGATVRKSILSTGVFVHSWAEVESSIILPNADVGRYAKLRNCIVEEGVQISENDVIGFDLEQDKQRFTISDNGIIVVTATDPERKPAG